MANARERTSDGQRPVYPGGWMRWMKCVVVASVVCGAALSVAAERGFSQEPPQIVLVSDEDMPDAPQPSTSGRADVPDAELVAESRADWEEQNTQAPAQSQPAQNGSGSQSAQPQPSAQDTQREKAEQQMKEQEKQRIVGVVPAFNVSYRSDAVSLSASQKLRLAFRSSIDPVTFAGAFLVAGYHEAIDDDPGFRWGVEGYGRRAGAAYLDAFDGTMIGNGFLPAILHQDPRYFRLGHGTFTHRILYAAATNVICKHDNTGKWEPNYSNVGGNILAGALSNLYYPSSNSGWGLTISNGMIVTAEGAIGSVFQEFWPDISRRFLHRDPTHGLDAQAAGKEPNSGAPQQQEDRPQP
jgi:hypothetical protein